MHLALTERQRSLRAELRAYFRELIPPDERTPGGAPDPARRRALLRRIGADGLLGLGWPVEYGGQGRGADEQFVFFDEAYRAGAPVSMVTLNTVGPTLMRYGTPEQKAYFLPRILSGDLVFAIGYTEPEAGTDLASLRTRAVREADGSWLIDGNKVFTSNAQQADWIWLACRTDPQAVKHHGISIILVPTDASGFSWTPIETVGGLTTTTTYYDGVRVPSGNLVGEENGGWGLITNQLNHERVALAAIGMQAEDHYRAVLEHARETGALEQPWARARLAEAHARLAATRLLNWRLVGDVGAGTLAPGDASGVKFAGTESTVAVYALCQEVLGEVGTVRAGSPGVFGDGELERMNRAAQINTFGGGVSEVQREIVATMRLGMRRRKR
ncbi:acyl-CoA dehydrogenase family protein [Streptomyces sp. NBC_01795]|uniref:acyl-CoA dehydrogenase family protein n=1 Tax=unclassified Streptomyces TaxID=2593676 RepID=UPI002DDC6121|nr:MULTISPECIES: acyl-CoA dehydrogenase family protein [unclassified Streptomyces]WSA93740.1 acyl-CoA dehydrogenase family protein [Streptomyces sp. NBC_01795]WSB78111.1 acyl-CoA dehydrogenase family protein [Streptomyces sp. NBC_01775]WSS13637.1 acyl-CoA dehydrogenase family protein [Streptomyces sp. NBC_01186]